MNNRELRDRMMVVIFMVVLLIAGGALGYMLLENWRFAEALYMTVITLSTVGFGEVRPLTDAGRVFTILLILSGVALVAVSANVLANYFLSPERGKQFWRRRKMRAINKLDRHVIICGAGRVGLNAAYALEELGNPFVLVDADPAATVEGQDRGWLVLHEDATKDETLLAAGCERARGLLVCTGNDSDNLFIVLSARALNPALFIVARSSDVASESKMRRVGADKVISPYRVGGRQMANMVLRPHVADFMEVVTTGSDVELWLEEIGIQPGSSLAGKTVIEADIRRRTGAMLIAVLRRKEQKTLMPDENTWLTEGDDLIVVGTREQLTSLESLVANSEQS